MILPSSDTAMADEETRNLPERVASCAIHHYDNQLSKKKGKPKANNEEWTVYAAIVAVHCANGNNTWVVSCATGTKCTSLRHKGCILHDSHAEVLARRGLIRVLWSEVVAKRLQRGQDVLVQQGPTNQKEGWGNESKKLLCHSLLIEVPSSEETSTTEKELSSGLPMFRLDPEIALYLYISDSPCGDASIYSVPSTLSWCGDNDDCIDDTCNANYNRQHEVLYTGAKVVISESTGVTATDCGGNHQLLATKITRKSTTGDENDVESSMAIVAREETQVLGKLRTKSGRSNLADHMRSTSMSCSDKIVLWSVLGLQGALLTHVLDPPVIPLTGVVVSKDSRLLSDIPQQTALERSVSSRVQSVWEFLSLPKAESPPLWKPPVPTVHVVPQVLAVGKASMACLSGRSAKKSKTHEVSGQKRKNRDVSKGDQTDRNKSVVATKQIPPCGIAFNWNQMDGDMELLVGARGIRQGKKPKRSLDYEKLESRLSRSRLRHDFETTEMIGSAARDVVQFPSYQQTKQSIGCRLWKRMKTRVLTVDGSPLAGWLRSAANDDDFNIEHT